MIDWIACLKTINVDFDNGGHSGTGEYEDPKYGLQEFLWQANTSSVQITWFDSEPFCICGKGDLDPDCECEWDWFLETEPKRKVFTKAQYHKYRAITLF